ESFNAERIMSAPDFSSFTGTWESDFGNLDLKIQGDRVTGTYGPNAGRIEGVLRGNIVQGTWRQAASCRLGVTWGTFSLTLSADGRSFRGQWHYLDEYAPGGGTWFGKR